MNHALGVLGGMGPLASQLFYGMVIERTAAARDQEHIDMILLSHATMPDRTKAILEGDAEGVSDLLLQDCLFLERAGCKAIVAACNTAHYFLHRLEHRLSIPLISMVRETADELAGRTRGGRVALLATAGTVETGLYQEALFERDVEVWVPDEAVLDLLMHLIYDCVKAGRRADASTLAALDEAVRGAGCTHALLGCTELSVIAHQESLGEFYVDPLTILADRAITFMGKPHRIQG